jgi:hypothetical protein
MLVMAILPACNNSSKTSFVLKGTLSGIKEGKIIMSSVYNEGIKPDTAIIKDGKFIFSGNISESDIFPPMYTLGIEDGKSYRAYFYPENSEMTLIGHADSLAEAIIKGGKIQDDYNIINKQKSLITKKYNIAELRKEFFLPAIPENRRTELRNIMSKCDEEIRALDPTFIKENPASEYSAILIEQLSTGKSADEIESEIAALDPKLATTPTVLRLRANIDKMKQTEVGIGNIITEAHNLSYEVDKKFSGSEHKDIIYLSVLSDNTLCALKQDATVKLITSEGKESKSFKAELPKEASTIATDIDDNIYVLGTFYEKVKQNVRGKVYERNMPKGTKCVVYDKKGVKKNELKLFDVSMVTGARVVEKKIVVADFHKRIVAIFDANTGELISKIPNMRVCCGILDLSINSNNQILVANLGAFRVNCYDFSGKSIFAFGKRGNGIDDFHGCCNPVSVAFLSNGGIVTVEKGPTRIKVYSKEGAKKVEGIEELVKGCVYIPMAVDTKDNVYLASKASGLVKCVPKK